MKNDKIVDAYNAIQPDADAKNRIRAKLMQQGAIPKRKHHIYKRVAALATAAAVLLFAIFAPNLVNQNDNESNPFIMRVYAMELQPDGTHVRQEIDITRLYGWGEHYDGEVLYIGLGLWFEFEGENISTVEFSLKDGFFATQYIGNRGEVPNITSWHVSSPPDFTTSRLVMYGNDFEKNGSTISFDSTMRGDILLFWGSHDKSINDWWHGNRIIEIDVKVIFEDGEVYNQQLDLVFNEGWGMGWIDAALLSELDEGASLGLFTQEQLEYILAAPFENFTLMPYALTELVTQECFEGFNASHEFYISGYDPILFGLETMLYFDITRTPIGVSDGMGFVVIVTTDDNNAPIINAYSIPLN